MVDYDVRNQDSNIAGKTSHDVVEFRFTVLQTTQAMLDARLGMSIGNDADGWFDLGWYSDAPGVSPRVTDPPGTPVSVLGDGHVVLDMKKAVHYFVRRNVRLPNIRGIIWLWVAIKDSKLNTLYSEKYTRITDYSRYNPGLAVDVPGVLIKPRIEGIVTAVDGETIVPFARITVGTKTVFSDGNGAYSIEVPSAMSILLNATAAGYKDLQIGIETPESGAKRYDLFMTPVEVPVVLPPPPVEEVPFWERLTAAAGDLITGRRTLAELMGLTELQEFVDMIVDEFGDEIMPGGKKVILLVPGTAVKKAIPKVTAKAATDIAELVAQAGAARYREFALHSTKAAADKLLRMTPAGQSEVIKKLSAYPDGREAVRVVLAEIAKRPNAVIRANAKAKLTESAVESGMEPALAKEINRLTVNKAAEEIIAEKTPLLLKLWNAKIPIAVAFGGLIGAIGALYSYVFSVEWTVKEGLNEILGIVVFTQLKSAPFSVSDEDLEKLNSTYLPRLRENAKLGRETIDAVKGFWPWTKDLWTEYADSVDIQIELFQDMHDAEAERRKAEKEIVEQVTFYIEVDPLPDKVTVNDVELVYEFGKYTGMFDPGTFTIRVEKEGYVTAVEEKTLGKGETYTHEYKLVAVPTKASVEIVTVPGYVNVYVADKFIDTTDGKGITAFFWPEGTYQFKFRRDGYDDKEIPVELWAGRTERILIKLDETVVSPTIGVLSVVSDPPNVDIWIAGVKIGTTDENGIFKTEIAPFTGDVTFTKEGYEDRTKSVSVWAGRSTPVAPTLTKKPVEQWLWKVDVNAVDEAGLALHPKILVNDSFTQKWAPDFILLLPGTYTISLELSGYETWEDTIMLEK